jgi:hypothetical protein
MRQGKASRDVRESWKREPIPNIVNPRAVSQIGQALGNKATESGRVSGAVAETFYTGRGFKAPMKSIKTRQGGSQGSY